MMSSGSSVPFSEERVGHPHHREVLVALAPAVARAGPALLAGPQEVPHVVGEDAVLDQDVALRRAALVVDAEGAPLVAHGAVVDERDERRGHQLADAALEDRRRLGDQVGLEAVAAGLVEQHAAAALADDHRHLAAGGGPGGQLGDGPLGGLAGQLLDVVAVEQLEADGVADAAPAGLHAGVAGGDHADREQRADLVVLGQQAVAVGHEDPPAAVAVAGADLGDGAVGGRGRPRRPGAAARPCGPWGRPRAGARRPTGCVVGCRVEGDRAGAAPAALRGRGPAASAAAEQPGLGQVGGVGEAGGVARHDPDAGAPVAARGQLLDPAVVEDAPTRTACPRRTPRRSRRPSAARRRGPGRRTASSITGSPFIGDGEFGRAVEPVTASGVSYRRCPSIPACARASRTYVEADDTALACGSGDVAGAGHPAGGAPCASRPRWRRWPASSTRRTTSVGMRVQLDHLAPTAVGAEVTAEATLEKVEGRRLTFTVAVQRRPRPGRRRQGHPGRRRPRARFLAKRG